MKFTLTGTLLILLLLTGPGQAADAIVYKSPSCGCCSSWVSHLRDNGYNVTAVDVEDVTPYKRQYGIPPRLGSCHTAVIEGYVIEGHVPAADISRLLGERPDILGLTVPGMPLGSPGMEMGNRIDPYQVLAIEKDGSTSVYSSYPQD